MLRTRQEEQMLYSTITFRHLLDSLARPGKINKLEYPLFLGIPPHYHSSAATTDVPVNFYALGALLTLLDREVSFAIGADCQWQAFDAPVVQWLTLRTGASPAAPGVATFALFCDGKAAELLPQLNMGTLLEPESSATALYCIKQLSAWESDDHEEWLVLELAGPGIEQTRRVSVAGLNRAEIASIKVTRQGYPLGIDIYLIDSVGHCVGLPRTTRMRIVEQDE